MTLLATVDSLLLLMVVSEQRSSYGRLVLGTTTIVVQQLAPPSPSIHPSITHTLRSVQLQKAG